MVALNSNQPLYSMQIENSIGCPTRALLSIIEEYDHWEMKMERFLKPKDK